MPNVTRDFIADPVAFIRANPVASMSDTPQLTTERVALHRYDPRVVKGADNGRTDRPRMRQQVATTMAGCTSFWSGRVNVTIVESAQNSERYKVNIFGVRGYLGWTFDHQEMDLGVFPYQVLSVDTLDTSW